MQKLTSIAALGQTIIMENNGSAGGSHQDDDRPARVL
jgi:hypothetical protein